MPSFFSSRRARHANLTDGDGRIHVVVGLGPFVDGARVVVVIVHHVGKSLVTKQYVLHTFKISIMQ